MKFHPPASVITAFFLHSIFVGVLTRPWHSNSVVENESNNLAQSGIKIIHLTRQQRSAGLAPEITNNPTKASVKAPTAVQQKDEIPDLKPTIDTIVSLKNTNGVAIKKEYKTIINNNVKLVTANENGEPFTNLGQNGATSADTISRDSVVGKDSELSPTPRATREPISEENTKAATTKVTVSKNLKPSTAPLKENGSKSTKIPTASSTIKSSSTKTTASTLGSKSTTKKVTVSSTVKINSVKVKTSSLQSTITTTTIAQGPLKAKLSSTTVRLSTQNTVTTPSQMSSKAITSTLSKKIPSSSPNLALSTKKPTPILKEKLNSKSIEVTADKTTVSTTEISSATEAMDSEIISVEADPNFDYKNKNGNPSSVSLNDNLTENSSEEAASPFESTETKVDCTTVTFASTTKSTTQTKKPTIKTTTKGTVIDDIIGMGANIISEVSGTPKVNSDIKQISDIAKIGTGIVNGVVGVPNFIEETAQKAIKTVSNNIISFGMKQLFGGGGGGGGSTKQPSGFGLDSIFKGIFEKPTTKKPTTTTTTTADPNMSITNDFDFN